MVRKDVKTKISPTILSTLLFGLSDSGWSAWMVILKVNLLGDHLHPLLLDDHLQGLDPVGENGPGQGPGDHTTIQTFSNFQSDDQMSDNVRRFLY